MPSPFISPGWRCAPSEARGELVEVLRDAIACIGMHEDPLGSNRGPQVDVWLRAAGVEPGQPWCASFATALYQRMEHPPIPRLASAYKIYEWAEKHGRLVDLAGELLPGDILGVFKKDDPTTTKREDFNGHVGLYVGPAPDGKLSTVEGNVRSYVRGLVRSRADWAWAVRPLPVA